MFWSAEMAKSLIVFGLAGSLCTAFGAIPFDASRVRPGPVSVQAAGDSVTVRWPVETSRIWTAEFSLDPARPVITRIGTDGVTVIERAQPVYFCSTGTRRGGWDQFFDLPPSHPNGTRSFTGVFQPTAARAVTAGDRVYVEFDGLRMGIFTGTIRYTFYPGGRLILQEAIASTDQPDTAYHYDAGLRMADDAHRKPGGNMESEIAYFDTAGQLRQVRATGPERSPVAVRYRALAGRTGGGTVVVFPAPHAYFMPRDFTTNMGHVWQSAWRGALSLGIRQLPDDNTRFYPWMNAPPGTRQHMGMFLLVSGAAPGEALNDVLRYTNRDRFAPLPGYKTVSVHWHFAYTVQAMGYGLDWVPPFKPVLKDMGVDANIIMDFHGDGHPADTTELRLKEVDAFYKACRAQSDSRFLLIPSEEANAHLGGHWSLVFPKPVHWIMKRKPDEPFLTEHPVYGKVYRTGNAEELLRMVREENGIMYQTHPRTKGSLGYPDKILETEHFRDPRYLGAGWKAMNSDLSSPRLGDRGLRLLDDLANWNMRKLLLGEVDVFQIDPTHELWGHMNVNYVRLKELPQFGDYGQVLDAISRREFFITTGEVLLPEVEIAAASPGRISVRARAQWTFPLAMAEIVWGDGKQVHRKETPLDSTRAFGSETFEWQVDAPEWTWARLAIWDVARNGAFVNPVWK
jgi:hypothetical protein